MFWSVVWIIFSIGLVLATLAITRRGRSILVDDSGDALVSKLDHPIPPQGWEHLSGAAYEETELEQIEETFQLDEYDQLFGEEAYSHAEEGHNP